MSRFKWGTNNKNYKIMAEKMKFKNHRIKTMIDGFDNLLFGGLHLQCLADGTIERPLVIAIRGEQGTSRALFCMQLLHGITKSMREFKFCDKNNKEIKLGIPLFYTDNKNWSNLSDMLMDTVISKCVKHIVEQNASGNSLWTGKTFCDTIFDIHRQLHDISITTEQLDQYIGEEILVYNLHTNALHITSPSMNTQQGGDTYDTPIYTRKHDDISDYCEAGLNWENKDSLGNEFFPICIYQEHGVTKDVYDEIREMRHTPEEYYHSLYVNDCNCLIPCIVIDKEQKGENDMSPIYCYINHLKNSNKTAVVVYLLNENETPEIEPDFFIEMCFHEDDDIGYMSQKLLIRKSVLQNTAHGWHLYKKRDYGIEVYPSSHVLLQRRRHMPRGVLRSQRDILTDTYQSYIDSKFPDGTIKDFECYNQDATKRERLIRLYKDFQEEIQQECPQDILQEILLSKRKKNTRGQATAIIGPANTYKRFLTLGGTFSACCRKEQTLKVLLDKEDKMMFQKVICPATIFRKPSGLIEKQNLHCLNCYKNIHFQTIRMGCITADEFFFYLIKQIRLSRCNNRQGITRILIDDLQKIEFCFPMLRKDPLFLTALMSICKDYEVELFILCDINAQQTQALRAQADNVVCTKRTGESELDIYIERYAGYSIPSKQWKCHITNVQELFYCDIKGENTSYRFNDKVVKNEHITSMEDYWKEL